MKQATVLYDIRVIARTVTTIVGRTFGHDQFPDPPELSEAGLARDEPTIVGAEPLPSADSNSVRPRV